MFDVGEVISYLEMCSFEGVNLQRGMNYHLSGNISVILMSVRKGAPYSDKIEDDGKILIYEGHNITNRQGGPNPKTVDQPIRYPGGSLTQNGYFYEAIQNYKNSKQEAEMVRVYEKVQAGIWVYNGLFKMIDAWNEIVDERKVFKFKMKLYSDSKNSSQAKSVLTHDRIIPSSIKLKVWKRDKGKCVRCGNTTNLHFDHIIPFSKGGSSLTEDNIQILCAKHNLQKHDKIE